jgi:ParB/RepB/Spo0J family partition protein
MPRVETITEKPNLPQSPLLLLSPEEIQLDPVFQKARPGPPGASEQASLEDLAASLRSVGQIVPCVVAGLGSGYVLVDGRRRHAAAQLIEGFKLTCVVGEASLQAAIHANLKRRGYNHLQFAYLCQELREQYGWKGTAEVAEFLGVSRAYVSEHDKLLRKPDGLAQATYDALVAQVGQGGMAAAGATYLLTHVSIDKIADVVEKAASYATVEDETELLLPEPVAEQGGAQPSSEPESTQPASPKPSKRGKPAERANIKTPEWMKEQKRKHNERVAKEKAANGAKPPKVTATHVKRATAELKAQKPESRPLARGLSDFERVFALMRSTAYPDVMRNFASFWDDAWRRGDGTDEQLIARWGQIAQLVEEHAGNDDIGPGERKRPNKKK